MTFFNSRNERLYHNYNDINNWLFTINYIEHKTVIEKNFILRDIKQNKNIIKYIYKKINKIYNTVEIEVDRLSKTEYDMLKNIETPTILNFVKTKQISSK